MIEETTFESLSRLPYVEPDAKVHYGESEFQFAEGWVAEHAVDTLVMIHGGCWLADYGLEHVRPLCAALAALNFNVWSLEYRRVGNPGGGWPGSFEDIADGVKYLQQVSVDDPARPSCKNRGKAQQSRFLLMGHSAGGHLALWLAARAKELALHIDHVIGLAAITDLKTYAEGISPCEKATKLLLGGHYDDQLSRYEYASPLPVSQSGSITLLHGQSDTIVPFHHADWFAARAEAKLLALSDVGHFDPVNPDSPVFASLARVLTA